MLGVRTQTPMFAQQGYTHWAIFLAQDHVPVESNLKKNYLLDLLAFGYYFYSSFYREHIPNYSIIVIIFSFCPICSSTIVLFAFCTCVYVFIRDVKLSHYLFFPKKSRHFLDRNKNEIIQDRNLESLGFFWLFCSLESPSASLAVKPSLRSGLFSVFPYILHHIAFLPLAAVSSCFFSWPTFSEFLLPDKTVWQ